MNLNDTLTFNGIYTSSDGSWKEITADEIKRLIALLIYMGLVKIGDLDKYCSVKTLYHGLWAREITVQNQIQSPNGYVAFGRSR